MSIFGDNKALCYYKALGYNCDNHGLLKSVWYSSTTFIIAYTQLYISQRCISLSGILLLEIPLAQIDRLQRIQNKAARLITRTRQRDHINITYSCVTSATIHWLPVCHRIQFKVLVNVFKCLHGLSPDYLTQLVHVHRRDNRLRQLDTFTLSEQVEIRVIGKCAFDISAPPLWNRLPITVRASNDILTFKRPMKTHLFQLYYK